MSNQILPSFAGQKWPFVRAPKFSTTIKTAVSGREYRTANWSAPRYEYKLDYEVLSEQGSATDMRQLMGFVNARGGSFDSFLFSDPDDNTVTLQPIGIGDGTTTKFQLVRTWGGYAEPIYDTNGAPSIYVNGALRTVTTHYTIDSAGMVTFVTAPAAAAPITASFSFYWRARFSKDGYEFSQFMQDFWELRNLAIITVKP
jgi:uncharacterized protein (TIGR02217 family)